MATILVAILFLAGCASYAGRGLLPGQSEVSEVEQRMGVPAMRWKEADGTEILVYPRGPGGYHTYMAHIGSDGRLASLENVLEPGHFARIRPNMNEEEVLRVLGPPYPNWITYFKARDELVWEWRYCDDWGEPARFNVLFDGTSGKVRTTASLTEGQRAAGAMGAGGGWRQWCSR